METPEAPTGATLFQAWMKERRISLRTAAETLGVSHVAVIEWTRGTSRPRPDRRKAIQKWTAGAIPSAAWLLPGERPEPVLRVRAWKAA